MWRQIFNLPSPLGKLKICRHMLFEPLCRKRLSLVRQSWSRLLWLLAGFTLCQVVLAVAIDCWLGAVRDPEFAGKLERLQARLAEAPGRPLVLMLGSSRTA